MAIDLDLLAIPPAGKTLLDKAQARAGSEYSYILFSTFQAMSNDFQHFGHPDWVEFQQDARALIPHYPGSKFTRDYQFQTNRAYGALDYLIAKTLNKSGFKAGEPFPSFLYSGTTCSFSKSTIGFPLKYWDAAYIREQKEHLASLSFGTLFQAYDALDMKERGVYKIHQIDARPQEKLQAVWEGLKAFLDRAQQLGGYVLVFKT